MKCNSHIFRKIISVIVILCIIVSFVSSVAFENLHAGHKHIGQFCYVCKIIKQENITFQKTDSHWVPYLFLLETIILSIYFIIKYTSICIVSTLIDLKVRLDC